MLHAEMWFYGCSKDVSSESQSGLSVIRIHSENKSLSNRIQATCHFVVSFSNAFESGNFEVKCKDRVWRWGRSENALP